jgi:hypothetical protein
MPRDLARVSCVSKIWFSVYLNALADLLSNEDIRYLTYKTNKSMSPLEYCERAFGAFHKSGHLLHRNTISDEKSIHDGIMIVGGSFEGTYKNACVVMQEAPNLRISVLEKSNIPGKLGSMAGCVDLYGSPMLFGGWVERERLHEENYASSVVYRYDKQSQAWREIAEAPLAVSYGETS